MKRASAALSRRIGPASVLILVLASQSSGQPVSEMRQYAGRYSNGPFSLFTVSAQADYIGVVPPFWTGKPYLAADEHDVFSMRIPHFDADRRVRFIRNESGDVIALESFHFDESVARFERLDSAQRLPVEHFLDGDVQAAIRSLAGYAPLDEATVASIASNLVSKYPSKTSETRELLQFWADRYPDSSMIHALYGYALLAERERSRAGRAFARAIELDPDNALAADALRRLRLDASASRAGYRKLFPYDLGLLFEEPTGRELQSVRRIWSKRDLRPRAVERVRDYELELEHAVFDVRILRHQVHGDVHYGAMLVPRRSDTRKLALVVEIRGVDPYYTPNDISSGTQLLRALGPLQDRFIFVIPALRGETLIFDGDEFVAEGDPSDSWDGATDDAIAIINASLAMEPKIDRERIAVYGKSRGGSVALLTGIRDERVGLVLDLAGPVDWFRAMESRFWSTEEVLADGLADGRPLETTEEGGQFYVRFVAPVVAGRWDLQQARHRMIASSPAYFLESLPLTYAFYGAEDRSVPVANARLLDAVSSEEPGIRVHVTTYAGRGHDTDPWLAYAAMVEALREWSAGVPEKQSPAKPQARRP